MATAPTSAPAVSSHVSIVTVSPGLPDAPLRLIVASLTAPIRATRLQAGKSTTTATSRIRRAPVKFALSIRNREVPSIASLINYFVRSHGTTSILPSLPVTVIACEFGEEAPGVFISIFVPGVASSLIRKLHEKSAPSLMMATFDCDRTPTRRIFISGDDAGCETLTSFLSGGGSEESREATVQSGNTMSSPGGFGMTINSTSTCEES